MIVRIDGNEYNAVTAAVTAFRFRAKYNKSCMSQEFSTEDLFKLLYVSIEDKNKPYYHNFIDMCRNDENSYRTAIAVYKNIMREDKGNSKKETDGFEEKKEDFDEFYAMATFSLAGLPHFLWDELSMIQILTIIKITFELKNGNAKPKELTYEETAQMYCIDDSTESKIQEYLDLHPEMIAEEEEESDGIL